MVDIRFSDFFRAILKPFQTDTLTQYKPLPPTLSISTDEYNRLMQNVHVPQRKDAGPLDIFNDISSIKDDVISRKFDNERMRELAPEIRKASTIFVSSILSPNNLQGGSLSYHSDSTEHTDTTIEKLTTVIQDHFTDLGLYTKLKPWLDEVMFGVGSRPILILPEIFLKELISKEVKATVGVENFQVLEEHINKRRIYSEQPLSFKDIAKSVDRELLTEVKIGLEQFLPPINTDGTPNNGLSDNVVKASIEDIRTKLIQLVSGNESSGTEALVSIHEDPQVAGLSALRSKATKAANKTKLNNVLRQYEEMEYKKESMISLSDISYSDDDEIGNPLMMELPSESVIPIFTPGSPHDHIGYFVILDVHGNPINVTEPPSEEDINNLQVSFNAMMGKGGMKEVGNLKNTGAKFTAVNKVYEHMLDQFITKSLNNMSIENVDITKNPNVYKCMFRRLLEHKKTKLLFVPEELMIYLRFDHHADGTGKSKLDSIKFALSLRITLLVSKILGILDSAIVRERVNVKFSEQVANPLALSKAIKNKIISSKLHEFTWDPDKITKSIARRSLSFSMNDIPGIEQFEITADDNRKSRTEVDDGIRDETNDMVITGLGVPHSALNQLSENEYSRSLATIDLLFSKDVSDYQTSLCDFLNKLIRTYVSYSTPLKKALIQIINESNKKDATDDTTPETDKEFIESFIESIYVTLPAPNIAADDSEYETYSKYEEMIDKLLESLYSQDLLANDSDAADQLTMIKHLIRNKLIRRYLLTTSFSNILDIPEIKDLDTTELVEIKRSIASLAQRLKNLDKLTGAGGEDSGGSYY